MRCISVLFIILFVFPVFSKEQYSPNTSLYEACNWENNAYTQRVIDEASNYCAAGSVTWPACLNKELLLSCKVDPFQISVFSQIKELQKTVMTDARIYTKKDNEIPKACFLASAVVGLNQYPPETSSYQYCHSSKSYETCKSMTFKNKKLKEEICNPNQPPNKSNIRNRPPCLDDRYIIPLPSILEGTSLWPKNTFLKAHELFKESIICKTSQDPYSCFFYSIYNIKRNLQSISNILENNPDTNTIDLVRNKNTPLFNEEEMKWAFAFYAHNGGLGDMQSEFPLFIKDFKIKITNPESNKSCTICDTLSADQKNDNSHCKTCKKYFEYHNTILSGKSLSINVLYNGFGKYINENKEIFADSDQLNDFVPNIASDLASFSNQKGILKQALDNLPRNNDSPENQEKEIFLDFVKRNCPATL